MKPCLLREHMGVHIAWDSNGRRLFATTSLSERDTMLRIGNYKVVPLNSAIANRIRDRLKERITP